MVYFWVALGSMALISNLWLLREKNGLRLRFQTEVENKRNQIAYYQKKLDEVTSERDELKLKLQYDQGVKVGRKTDFLWNEMKQQIEGEEGGALLKFTHRNKKGEEE